MVGKRTIQTNVIQSDANKRNKTNLLEKQSQIWKSENSQRIEYARYKSIGTFGSPMNERTFTSGNAYRYGFNGKENDNEVKGDGNQQDYGMRIYDNRLGRFLSIDPLTAKYAYYSPYQFAGNSPVRAKLTR